MEELRLAQVLVSIHRHQCITRLCRLTMAHRLRRRLNTLAHLYPRRPNPNRRPPPTPTLTRHPPRHPSSPPTQHTSSPHRPTALPPPPTPLSHPQALPTPSPPPSLTPPLPLLTKNVSRSSRTRTCWRPRLQLPFRFRRSQIALRQIRHLIFRVFLE